MDIIWAGFPPVFAVLGPALVGLASSVEWFPDDEDEPSDRRASPGAGAGGAADGSPAQDSTLDGDLDVPLLGETAGCATEAADETVAVALSNVPSSGPRRSGPGRIGSREGSGSGDGKPLLAELPHGRTADLVVMEWMEFLVGVAGREGALRAIAYYEAADWLRAEPAEGLRAFLRRLPADAIPDAADESLTGVHHAESLRFIARLSGESSSDPVESSVGTLEV